ncbi:ERF family protein [Micromonospora okii]|uniref:ERF family protein n=1 Tax=Micromonospora okii TaxID=1182970 RepID=UPI001E615D56|nr:ERF family protein [Micromonospora okii]
MADPKTLDEALLAFQADPPTLVKDKSGQVGNQRTRYADLVQVNAVVLSALNKLGVVYKTRPIVRDVEPRFVLAYELRHVASGTAEAGEYPLKLSENPMQMGSAITYARRYVLLALTGVAAEDEDDDGQSASGRYAQRAEQRRRPPAAGGGATAQRAHRPRQAGPALPGEQPTAGRAGGGISEPQQRKLHASLRDAGKADRASALAYISDVVGHEITSTGDLTGAEASLVLDRLAQAAG